MSSSRQFAQHVRVSSTEDVSYSLPATSTGGTNDVIQTIVTGRKCWKTLKGKGEVVWPPYLEAALIAGLEKYRPVETRSTRALGRYPMRNKFISQYIFDTTGKRRTPKQVGSRLQQLRDTCEGKRILKLLSARSVEAAAAEKSASMEAAASASSPPSPPASHPRENITIDVLPANVSWPSEDVGMILGPSPTSHDPSSSGTTLNTPRPLRVINPTVTFKSATPLTAQSVFKVFHNGTIVHTETTEFQLCSSSCLPQSPWSSQVECSFLYSTTLVPQYWQRLCESLDLNPYTIEQDVVTSTDTSSSESPSPSDPTRTLLSVVYSFNMYKSSGSTPPQSPISTSSAGGSVHADALSFTAESTPEHTEYDMFMMNSLSNQSLPTYAPLHTQTLPQMAPGAYEPPELVQDGEEGYASLPPSPLDFTFATSLTSGLAADPASALSQTLCPGYAEDERVVSSGQHHHHHHQHTAPYIHDGVGVNGVDVGVSSSMLNGIPYSYYS